MNDISHTSLNPDDGVWAHEHHDDPVKSWVGTEAGEMEAILVSEEIAANRQRNVRFTKICEHGVIAS